MTDRVAIAPIRRVGGGPARSDQDLVAIEAPLAVQLKRRDRSDGPSLGLLMRTPGDDRDLLLGLLYAEGIIRTAADVVGITMIAEGEAPETAEVILGPGAHPGAAATRAQMATSACGLCGRLAIAGLDALAGQARPSNEPGWPAALIAGLPATLRARQAVFAETGGLHAAGLFDAAGVLLALREDVGRHNAVDKVVGAALDAGWLPARHAILAVSGRVAFEIVQKAVMAGVAAIVAVGAPSSLAVEAARAARLTLVGFARDGRFNVYAGADRIIESD
jgi:FdhD protein